MNTRDVEAARRLIAQFEDRAVGRHNSTMFSSRETELPRPEQVQRRDIRDAQEQMPTIDEQEIEHQYRGAVYYVKSLASRDANPQAEGAKAELLSELEELKQHRLRAAQATKILRLAFHALKNPRGEYVAIHLRRGPSFAGRPLEIERWSYSEIADELQKLIAPRR
jgi:hypothetical protein